MNFNEFVSKNEYCHVLPDGFALWKMNPVTLSKVPFTLTDIHSILLILEGEMVVKINNKQYLLTKNCFVDTINEQPLEVITFSKELFAYQLLFTETFIQGLLKNNPPLPITYVLNRKEEPILLLNDQMTRILMEKMNSLEIIFQDRTHCFQEAMLKCNLWIFFMEIANAFLQEDKKNTDCSQETKRQKQLFLEFMQLLHIYIQKEHFVHFYASKLCITPQYLNRVIKYISGKNASQWISRQLLGEIYHSLAETDLSIQLLADHFNFPDQATFTKFFKRQSGISPTEYRKQLKITIPI